MRTLPARLDRISGTTTKVVEFMKRHPKIESVLFPLDESFPQYRLARQQMSGACGLFTFVLKAENRDQVVRFCEHLEHIMMAVSWGGHESLVIPKCSGFPETEFNPNNPEHRYVRMYVGMEDANYLIEDLKQGLAAI